MIIDTELIKNKNFEGPISNNLLKASQEYRVLAVLRYLFPGKYEQMKHGDKPDLQDTINHIGIEVTSAVQENDMKATREFAEIDKTSSKNLQKSLDKIRECGYEINDYDGIISISKHGTPYSEKTCICNTVLKKCKKITNYKNSFKVIGLAILLPEPPTKYAEEHVCDWIKEMRSEIDQSFDFIYVISSRFCIIYNIKEKRVDKKDIGATSYQLLYTIARMTAEGELTLDSYEWK